MKNLPRENTLVLEKNTLFMTGPLIKETVMALSEKAKQAITTQTALDIDLSGVTECDSASLALLLEIMRDAKHKNMSVKFMNMPKSMLDIVKVNGLMALLPIS